jgi:predicted CxxxxCH...CXXCH cytochrome family protein
VAHLNSSNYGCGDCHGDKTVNDGKPNGAVFPNHSGAHTKHLIFAGSDKCNACHNNPNAGSGSPNHGLSGSNPLPKKAILSFLAATYQAETGGVASYDYNTAKCSNISCHGGNLTPAWNTSGNNLLANCTNCHQLATNPLPALPAAYAPSPVTPQYNSYWSGDGRALGHKNSLHTLHLGLAPTTGPLAEANFGSFSCSACHDTTPSSVLVAGGSSHYSHLDTASSTIRASLGYAANGANMSCFTVACHVTNPLNWK